MPSLNGSKGVPFLSGFIYEPSSAKALLENLQLPNRVSRHILNSLVNTEYSECLNITEKVAFNIASEASYVYILSGQKFIKNAKKWSNLASF